MYRLLQRSSGNVLGYECTGQLTEAEIKEIHREIDAAVQKYGRIRNLLVLHDLGIPEAVWQDLKMTETYLPAIDRFAIVGDADWHEWLTSVTDMLSKGRRASSDLNNWERPGTGRRPEKRWTRRASVSSAKHVESPKD